MRARLSWSLSVKWRIFGFASRKGPPLRILNSSHLAQLSPADARLDPKMELLARFPYAIPYASALARSLVDVLRQRRPPFWLPDPHHWRATFDSFHKLRGEETKNTDGANAAANINATKVRANEESRFPGNPA